MHWAHLIVVFVEVFKSGTFEETLLTMPVEDALYQLQQAQER